MAIRTTNELVEGVISVDDSISLTPFIAAASALVDRVKKVAVDNALLLPEESTDPDRDTLLQQIETWLAAHFYAMRKPRPTSETAGPVQASYQSKVDLNLYLSHYGQMAIVLDTTGTLKALSKGQVQSSVTWLGKSPRTPRC